jgi:hydroxymethylpyrimidine/phosphomethylpyrimidine kinase
MSKPRIVAVGGWDPTGGAGIVADVKAIHACGGYALTVVTALVPQDHSRVFDVVAVDAAVVKISLEQCFTELPPAAVKSGLLTGASWPVVAAFLAGPGSRLPWVCDPVWRSNFGDALGMQLPAHGLQRDGLAVLTPNQDELRSLAAMGSDASETEAAEALLARGWNAVLVKGGHASGADVVDCLYTAGSAPAAYIRRRMPGSLHGSGCILASALATGLARGETLAAAFQQAESYMDGVWAGSVVVGPDARRMA